MGKEMCALGLMSGTSMDGIDIAVIDTDGRGLVRRKFFASYPYSESFRTQLRSGLKEALSIKDRDERPGRLRLLEQYLTDLHVEAVSQFLDDHDLKAAEIDVIGFHGHTILHEPARCFTVQIGDGLRLAEQSGIDVVYDLRAADCAAGGQGAPLAPVYHQALFASHVRPVAILNIGGVANVTWIGPQGEGDITAFDIGPGNALIDDWVRERLRQPFDEGGQVAAGGTIRDDVVERLLSDPFFIAPLPKSLDRGHFSAVDVEELSVADGAATLTAFTARAVRRARALLREEPLIWVVTGGGRKNQTLMAMIAEQVDNAVVPAEAVQFDGDAVEAEAWAYLAVRSLHGLPITFPGTTGVDQPLTGGVIARAM